MEEVHSTQIKRRIFTRNRGWNTNRVAVLVFSIALAGAVLALCFSWSQP